MRSEAVARTINRLSARRVETERRGGRHADGGGLYLTISENGGRRWVFLYRDRGTGKLREMGLGSARDVTLSRAREKARDARAALADGNDPMAERTRQRAARAAGMTFRAAAEAYIAAHKSGWRNPKHAAQWEATLRSYAYPAVGQMDVAAVAVNDVMRVIEPIWSGKTETANRVRGRIESVLDWAAARGHRRGDNPARWRGHLDKLLPKRSKVAPVKHQPALPFRELPAFMAELREQQGMAALALEFTILTAARTGETIGATWDEISGDVWTVPAGRMKARKEHRVPLSSRAREILDSVRPLSGDYLFPGPRGPLSNGAMLALLERMGRGNITVHGFRSSFRDWCGEVTSFPRELAEMALAHVIEDKAEKAYARGQLLERRRKLMDSWSSYCATVPSEVIELPRRPLRK
jgi:integrase